MSSASSAGQQRAQAFFKTANDAALKNNFDYAIQMYQEACKLTPDHLPYRQALRGVARKKFANTPAKVGRMVGARTHPIRLRAKTAKAKGQWTYVLEVSEEVFAYNPWDTAASEDAADAAENLGLRDVAQWLLESVAAQAGESASFYRHLARVYALNENWQKAIQAWDRVKRIDPTDEEAGRQINSLSANATIARSGLGEAIHKANQTAAAGESFAPDAEDIEEMALAPEERLRKQIQAEPDRIGAYLDLADLYRMKDRLDDAGNVLALGLKRNPGDATIQLAYEEVQISRIHKFIESWTRRAQADPNDANAKSQVAKGTAKLSEYEIAALQRRLGLRPNDLNLRHKLGLRLAQAGRHGEAIAEFQQSRNDPTLKVDALLQAGLSFEANGVLKLAERGYLDALKAAEAANPVDQPMLNSLHYRLGRVAESQGNIQAAEEHYNEVAANDYAYLDVAQRLRSLNPSPPS